MCVGGRLLTWIPIYEAALDQRITYWEDVAVDRPLSQEQKWTFDQLLDARKALREVWMKYQLDREGV